MSTRVRIAFATCGNQAKIARRTATRFAAVADLAVHECAVDGSDADSLLPGLIDSSPDVVIAPPRLSTLLTDRLRTTILPIEFSADVLVSRVDEALRQVDSVAVLAATGGVSPASARVLRRAGGSIHLLFWDSHAHLRDLVARAKRMGVQAIVGGEYASSVAREEGLLGLSVHDDQGDNDSVVAGLILKAAAQHFPRLAGCYEVSAAYCLILEKIAEGLIGPHDTALVVDSRGLVTAGFAHRCHEAEPRASLAVPTGVSITEALRVPGDKSRTGVPGQGYPLQLDVYSLAAAGSEGYVVVVRGEPRAGVDASRDSCIIRARGDDERLVVLAQRLDALLERTDGFFQARRPRVTPRRLLGSLRRRMFLIDWNRVRYFELRSGLVHASTITGESYATNYTLTDIMARVDPRDFFRIHRNIVVNLNYVTEVERYGQGQLRLVLDGPDTPAFVVSRPASAALRKLLKY